MHDQSVKSTGSHSGVIGVTPNASNRGPVHTFMIVMIVILCAGLAALGWFAGTTYWGKLETERQFKQTKLEREAERKERAKLEKKTNLARQETADAESIARFAMGVLQRPDSQSQSDSPYTVKEALDVAVQRLDAGGFAEKPKLELRVRREIGAAYSSLRSWDAAEPQLRRVLDLTKAIWGDQNPALIESLWGLAHVLLMKGNTEEGNSLKDQALALYDKCLEDTPWGRVPRLYGMAQGLADGKQFLAAASQVDYAILVLNRQFGPDHPLIFRAMLRKAELLQEGEQLSEAESVFLQAIDHLKRRLPPTHPHIADALSLYTKLLLKTQRAKEAEQTARECMSIREATLGDNDWRRASAKCLVGEVLLAQDRYADAEPMLTEGLKVLDEQADTPEDRIRNVRECVAKLYESWGKPEKAEEYRGHAGKPARGARRNGPRRPPVSRN